MRRRDNSKPPAGSSTTGAATPEPAPAPTVETAPLAEAKPTSAVRDGFVLLCIATVSAAIAMMLFTQFGLSLPTAAIAGVGAWIVFMLIHKQVQKSAQIAQLKAELARARFQSNKPRPAGLRGMPMPPLAGATATLGESRTPDFGAAMAKLDATQSGSAPARGFSAPHSFKATSDATTAPAADRAVSAPSRGMFLTPDQNIPPPPSSSDAATSVDLTGMHMPANSDGPSLAVMPGNATTNESNAPRSEMIRDHWSFRPRAETAGSAQSMPGTVRSANTVEGNLELVQRKIRELAEEVNSVEPSRPVKPLRADVRPNPTTDAIEHSIGALKAAASTMRERPAFGDLLPKLTMPSATPAKPQTPEPAALPGLDELVIPATAERIAGSDAAASRSAPAPSPHELPLPELPSIDLPSGPTSAAAPRVEAIARAIENRAMDVFLAPIVTLSEHSVSHYEMTVALRSGDGARLDAHGDDFAAVGLDHETKFDIERLLRAAALSLRMEARDKDGSLLTGIMGSSLTSRGFLETVAQVYEARPRIATQLVVTLSQLDMDDLTPAAWRAIRDMHSFGFRFALDKIEHMRTDFAALATSGFRFVRLDPQILFNGISSADRLVPADEIYQRATLAGLSIIASSVADAKTQKRLLEGGIGLGQGPLFGAARQVMLDGVGPTKRSAAA